MPSIWMFWLGDGMVVDGGSRGDGLQYTHPFLFVVIAKRPSLQIQKSVLPYPGDTNLMCTEIRVPSEPAGGRETRVDGCRGLILANLPPIGEFSQPEAKCRIQVKVRLSECVSSHVFNLRILLSESEG